MSFPIGSTLHGMATRIERNQVTRRAQDPARFFRSTSPERAARATQSLTTAYPWMPGKLAAQMGAFGVDPVSPAVAEIAVSSLARQLRRGFIDQGLLRNTNEVMNVRGTPRNRPRQRSFPLPDVAPDGMDQAGWDRYVRQGASRSGMTPREYARWQTQQWGGTPEIGELTPGAAANSPATAEDLGIPIGTGQDYARNIMGPMTTETRREFARRDPSELAEQFPQLAEQFSQNQAAFVGARISEATGGAADLDLALRNPSVDSRDLAQRLPSLDTTLRHLRNGGMTVGGIPIPDGTTPLEELSSIYDHDRRGTLNTFQARLDRINQLPQDNLPDRVRRQRDALQEAVDQLGGDLQSIGPDVSAMGYNFNLGDVSDSVWSATKGTTRTAVAAMDFITSQALNGAFRQVLDNPGDLSSYAGFSPLAMLGASANTQFGTNIPTGAAEATIAETDLGIMLERAANGEAIDIGSGFFVSPDSEVGRTRHERSLAHGNIGGHVITLGRSAAQVAQLEPDSVPFNVVSGAVDLALQLIDPGAAVVDAAAGSRLVRRALAEAGGVTATRSVHPDRFADFLQQRGGQRVLNFYADLDPDDAVAIDRAWRETGQSIPESYHWALADGPVGDTEYVEEMLRNVTGMGLDVPSVPTRGAAIAPAVAWRRQRLGSRMAQDVPETGDRALDIEDAADFAANERASWMNARVDEATIATLVGRIHREGYELPTRVRVQQIERQLESLPDSGPMLWRGTTEDAAVVRQELEDTIAELRPGLFINRPVPRRNALREIWLDGQRAKREALIAHGTSPQLAHELTNLHEVGRRVDDMIANDWAEEGAYWLRLTTDTNSPENVRVWGMVDGEDISDLSRPTFAHMQAEHLSRYLPLEEDYRQLARLTRSVPQEWVGRLWARGRTAAENPGQVRSYAALTENFMNKVWKPSRLLRPAWPIRVVGEEQFRIASTGMDSAVNHPIDYLAIVMGARGDGRMARVLGEAPDAVGRYATDVTGEPWAAISEFQAVHNRGARTWLIASGQGSGGRFEPYVYRALDRTGAPTTGYHGAWADLLARAHSSDDMRQVAQIRLGEHSLYDSVDEFVEAGGGSFDSVDELRLGAQQNQVQALRAELADSHPELLRRAEPTFIDRLGTPQEGIRSWDDYVQSIEYRLQEMTAGNDDLVHTVARGRFADGPTLDNPNTSRLNRAAVKRLEQRYGDVAPDVIPGDRKFHDVGLGRATTDTTYDRAMERLYSMLGATPTDRLSRSPAFRQFYWRRVQELLPYADDATQRQILDMAGDAGKLPTDSHHLRLSAYMDEMDTVKPPTRATLRRAAMRGKGDLNMEMLDEFAKHAALDNTRWLLYDVHKRGQFMDAMRLVFPFGEAWKEVITRWASLTASRPGTVVHRGSQLVRGAAGGVESWEEVVKDPTQHGHIFENANGQVVFGYPTSQWFTAALTGVPVELTGTLSGLTLMNSVIPGVGPTVQVPASMSRALRESPRFDEWRDVLFPYGMVDFQSLPAETLLPPGFRRIIEGVAAGGLHEMVPLVPQGVSDALTGPAEAALLGHSPDQDRLFLNSAFDVMRYLVSTGEYSTANEQEINRLVHSATERTGALYIIRGLAQLTMPSSPQFEFQVEDQDGSLMMLRALTDRYRQLQDDDFSTASQRFLEQYGENLSLVMQAKTVPRTASIPVTEAADRWVRERPGIEDDYPLTFGLFAPDNDGGEDGSVEFDQNAYNRWIEKRALRVLGREMELEDLVGLANDRYASIEYRRAQDQITEADGGSLSEGGRQYLSQIRQDLEQRYPGFNNDSLPHGPSTDQLRIQGITEMRGASDDDRIARPLRETIRSYLDVHDTALSEWAPREGSQTYYDSQGTRGIRDYLRDTVYPGLREDLPDRYRSQWDAIFERVFGRVMLAPWMEEEAAA